MSRSGAAPPPKQTKRHKLQSLSYLEKKVETIVESSRNRIQKTGPSAHLSGVSSMLFSPKSMLLYTFSFGGGRNNGELPNLKVGVIF